MRQTNNSVIGSLRYTRINLSGRIQGVATKERIHFACLQLFFKDNNKSAHWVCHSKLRSLDIDEFFKRTPNFDEKKASVTGKT